MSPTFTWPVRVYYEDTDASGVVYHANYLRYLERARTEWLRACGHGQEALRDSAGLAFTLANMQIDFLRPARMDDELIVTAVIKQLRGASLLFEQTIYKRDEPEPLFVRATARVACVDQASFRPRPLPAGFFQTTQDAE